MPRLTLKSALTTLGPRRICTWLQMLALLLICTRAAAQLPTAQTLASRMKIGWNLGNTLEAICSETIWGGAYTTQTTIDAVKASGFNTVRLPVSWDCHSNNGVIDAAWMARVKEVVDYCIKDSLYVVMNIHWDNGWLENNVTTAAQNQVNAKQQNYWTQIANYFKNYNDHLLFASANEPAVSDATGMSVLLSYHQTFVNAVRATGGNNSTRTLIVQGPSTNPQLTDSLMTALPNDPASNRLMVEVHYYEPAQFAIIDKDESWGRMFYYWGNGYHSTTDASRNATWGEEGYMEDRLNRMKRKYVDRGIPVIIGEFAAPKRTLSPPSDQALHDASRWYFYKYLVNSCRAKGIIPYVWDINMGIYNRSNGTVLDPAILSAVMQGASAAPTYLWLTNRATGLMADGMYRSSNGANAGQWSYSGSDAQQWSIESVDGYIKLKNKATGLYLDGMGSTTNGAVAGQWANSSSYNQQWKPELNGGYVKFRNRATGLYLDGLGQTTNGADLAQWAASSSNNQQWTLTPVGVPVNTSAAVASTTAAFTTASTANTLEVYPNPFTNTFAVKVDKKEKIERIAVIDANGKTVEMKLRPSAADLLSLGASLNSGTYVVEATGRGWKKTAKVIKMK